MSRAARAQMKSKSVRSDFGGPQTVTRAMLRRGRKDSSSDDMMDSLPRRKGRHYTNRKFFTINAVEPERSWMSRICLDRLYWGYKPYGPGAWVDGALIMSMTNYHGWDLIKGKRNALPKGKWVNIGECKDGNVTRNLKTSRETCCNIFDNDDVAVKKYLGISGDTKMSAAKDSDEKIRDLNKALWKLKLEPSVSVDSVASVLITSPNIQKAVAEMNNGNRTDKWICDDPSQDFRQLKGKVVEMRLIALNDPDPMEQEQNLARALATLKDLEAQNFATDSSSQNWTRSLAVAIARVLHEKWNEMEGFEDFIVRIVESKSTVMADEMRRVYIASMEQKCRSKKIDYALINQKRTRGQVFEEKSLVDAVEFFEGLRKSEFFEWIDEVRTTVEAPLRLFDTARAQPLRLFDTARAQRLLKEGAEAFVVAYLSNYKDLEARVMVVRIGVPILTHFFQDPKIQKFGYAKRVYMSKKDGELGWRETIQAYLIDNKHIEDYSGLTKDMHAFFVMAGIIPNSRFDKSYTVKMLYKCLANMPELQ